MTIHSDRSFNVLDVLVQLPDSFIDTKIVPLFVPRLEDASKYWGKKWKKDLPLIHDPEDKYTFVKKVTVVPKTAIVFVKVIASQNAITSSNSTFILQIDEKAYKEVTGNVSFFFQLAAFNQNHTTFLQ